MSFKFGDVLENGYAAESNPYFRCIFLRKTKNRIHVMEFDGRLSQFYTDDHKLTKVGSVINSDFQKYKNEMNVKKKEYMNREM